LEKRRGGGGGEREEISQVYWKAIREDRGLSAIVREQEK
jgi:hypothetical protein